MAKLEEARDVGTPARMGCSRCGGTGADLCRSVRDKGAPAGGRARATSRSFGQGRSGDRGAEDAGGVGYGHRSRLRLAPLGHAGRARTRSGARGPRGGGADLCAAPGKRQELPGPCLAHVSSQRHPPTWGGKGLDSPATPVVAVLGGGRAWVFRAGLGCLQGAASDLPSF